MDLTKEWVSWEKIDLGENPAMHCRDVVNLKNDTIVFFVDGYKFCLIELESNKPTLLNKIDTIYQWILVSGYNNNKFYRYDNDSSVIAQYNNVNKNLEKTILINGNEYYDAFGKSQTKEILYLYSKNRNMLYKFDIDKKELTSLFSPTIEKNNEDRHIFEYNNKLYLLLKNNILYCIDLEKKVCTELFDIYSLGRIDSFFIKNNKFIFCVIKDDGKTYRITWDIDTNTFSEPEYISSSEITCYNETRDFRIYMTLESGIYMLNPFAEFYRKVGK